MLSTIFSSDLVSDLFLDLDLDSEFINTTSILDIVSAFSPDAADFLVDGLDFLDSIDGEVAIADGIFDLIIPSASGDDLGIEFDVLSFLSTLNNLIENTSGSLTLIDGIVDASLEINEDIYPLEGFDLASFAADGVDFLISAVDLTVPIEAGAFPIDFETGFGPVSGTVDIAGGDLDVVLDTPVGTLDFVLDFGPEAQYEFALPTFLNDIDININLNSGNIEVPLFLDTVIELPLSSLSGEITLSGGIAEIEIDGLLEPVSVTVDVAELVNELVTDTLTGVSVDATLTEGEFDLIASSGTETFATAFDVVEVNAQAFGLLSQIEGSIALEEGIVTGSATVGDDNIFSIEQTIADIGNLLAIPVGDIPSFVEAIV